MKKMIFPILPAKFTVLRLLTLIAIPEGGCLSSRRKGPVGAERVKVPFFGLANWY
ncbi:MAG TPA: hypothetical protein VN249_07755 [Prolixibacteraceae bacterium]|nr:hypothetical protein [Prolixibacteraceae bacterium]